MSTPTDTVTADNAGGRAPPIVEIPPIARRRDTHIPSFEWHIYRKLMLYTQTKWRLTSSNKHSRQMTVCRIVTVVRKMPPRILIYYL